MGDEAMGMAAQWSDQGIITESFGQFLIFIISKCVRVILLTFVYVPYGWGAKLPLYRGYPNCTGLAQLTTDNSFTIIK